METKPFYFSKTFWFNIAAGIVAAAALIDPTLLNSIGINPAQQTKVLTIVGSVVAICNIILRLNTTGATLTLNKPTAPDGK